MDSTIQKCFRVRRFPVPCQPFGRCVIPSGCPSVTVPSVRTPDRPSIIRSDDMHFCPDHPLCREGSVQLVSARPDVSAARPDASLYSTSSGFFPSSNKGKINQLSRWCGIPFGRASPQSKNRNSNTLVRTSDSLGPYARSSKKEIADLTSTVRMTTYHGPDPSTSVMEIACWRPAVRTFIPHGPDARSLIFEILAADMQPSGRLCLPSGHGS